MSGIYRNVEPKINSLLELFPCVVVVGVRQGGKTTLAQKLRPNWSYFDLEKSSDIDLITRDYDFFFRENSANVIIDEAQRVPQIFNELRSVIDQNREKKGRFIVTGSSSFELLKGVSESLAGRAAIVELGTLKLNEFYQKPLPSFYDLFTKHLELESLPEIVDFLKQIKNEISHEEVMQFFLKGGYPEPVLSNNNVFYQNWMENYFRLYIERDVRGLFPKLNFQNYRRFVQMLSALSGTIINRAEVGRSLDTSELTVTEYFDIAHGSFIWRKIPSFEKSVSKSLIKMPKGSFRDSGLSHYIQRIVTHEQLMAYPQVGRDWEAFVCEEIIKGMQALMITNCNYSYYRTKNGAEVDLILEGNFGVLPIEIKFGMNTFPRQLMGMKQFLERNKLPIGLVINNSAKIKLLADNIVQIPATMI